MMSKKSHAGFSFVDTMIYIALFSSTVAFVIVFVYQLIDNQSKNRSQAAVEEEALFLMRKIEGTIVGAGTIREPGGSATSSRLSVDKFNYPLNPVDIERASGNVFLSRGGAASTTLNSKSVSVSNLVFQHLSAAGGEPAALKVTLTVVSLGGQETFVASTTLENTFYLRR